MGVPRRVRAYKAEPCGKFLSNDGSLFTKRCECTDRTAKLDNQRLPKTLSKPFSPTVERRQPTRSLEAHGDGRRRPEQRTANHRGVLVLLGQFPERLLGPKKVGLDEWLGPLK